MSSLKTTNILHPSSTTNNIVLASDGSTTVGNLVTTQIQGGAITRGTAVASTSGTSIDFTGIPSWAKRITVILDSVSTTSTGVPTLRLGTSSGVENTGYTGGTSAIAASTVSSQASATSGFELVPTNNAGYSLSGQFVITNITGNVWVLTGAMFSGGSANFLNNGRKALASTLTRVQLTTTGGTDTFDAGSINILYEG